MMLRIIIQLRILCYFFGSVQANYPFVAITPKASYIKTYLMELKTYIPFLQWHLLMTTFF